MTSSTVRTTSLGKVALVVGFLGVSWAVISAYTTPTTTYEVSIYRGAPAGFWIGCGIALATGISVVAARAGRRIRLMGMGLAGLAIFAIVSLPALRSYYFYGLLDSLTHLGWARELAAGLVGPTDLIYPGGHLIASILSSLTGVAIRDAMVLTVSAFALVYFVFVPLAIRTLTSRNGAVLVGAFSAFLLLPIYNIGTSLLFVSFTLGMLFVPLVIYLFFRYLAGDDANHGFPSPFGVLLALSGAALLLLHPQATTDVLLLFASATGLQLVARWRWPDHTLANHRLMLGQTVLLGGIYALWNSQHEAAFNTFDQLVRALTQSGQVGSIVSQRSGSLEGVGAGLWEMLFKLFLLNVVFAAFATGLVLALLVGRVDRDSLPPRAQEGLTYLVVGGLVLIPFSALHFVGSVSTYFFRHLGVGMVLLTFVGAAGLYYVVDAVPLSGRFWRTGLAVCAAVAIVLSVPVFFASPYIYLPSHHVTEAQMNGYNTTFEFEGDNVTYAGIRGGVDRYSDAFIGSPSRSAVSVSAEDIETGLPDHFRSDTYFVVTETDIERETAAYRSLRFSRSTFEKIERQSGVSRIASNGQFRLYFVDGRNRTGN